MRRASLYRSIATLAPLVVAACGLDASGLDRAAVEQADSGSVVPTDASQPPPHADAYVAPPPSSTSPPDGAGLPPIDAAGDSPVDAAPSPACDQDGDGHAAMGGCGGDDCCDTDARAHPGDVSYYSAPNACGSFDYDCNGAAEPEYAQANCQLDFFGGSCKGDGFASATACGAMGSYTSCNYAVFTCNAATSSRVQSCR